MKILNLDILVSGLPGISATRGAFYREATIVGLKKQGFDSGVVLQVEGEFQEPCQLIWTEDVSKTVVNSWRDEVQIANFGAVGTKVKNCKEMNIVKATHQLAMDMNALAELSRAKGFHNDAKDFYLKAFELEKKAALMTATKDEDPIPHFILLRSAAALALKAGQFKESEKLVEICLSENPPLFIRNDLQEILDVLHEEPVESSVADFEIKGLLMKVNAEENEITIKDDDQEQNYAVLVPQSLLKEIITNYWFQKVLIQVRQTQYGVMVLENISAAA